MRKAKPPKPGTRVRTADGAAGVVAKSVPDVTPPRVFVDWDEDQSTGWGIKRRTTILVDELEVVKE